MDTKNVSSSTVRFWFGNIVSAELLQVQPHRLPMKIESERTNTFGTIP